MVRVEELSVAERRVWEAFERGEEADFTTGDGEQDAPARGDRWGAERTIRAGVVAELLLREEARPVAGLRVKGARIAGELNLSHSGVHHSARFLSCFFDRAPNLYWTRALQVSFTGSRLPGLSGANAQVGGHLRLDGCVFTGTVELRGAQIAGSLTLDRARVDVAGLAVDCDRMQADRGVGAIGLRARGQVRLSNVTVHGTLILDHARLAVGGSEREALNLDGLVAEGNVFCRHMAVTGMITCRNARVTGPFAFTATTIERPGEMAFRGSRITASGGLFLGGGFSATGSVRLADSRVERELSLHGARLDNAGGEALQAGELQVEGSVNARELRARGRVDLSMARVSGSLVLDGAELAAPGGVALDADGCSVGGSLSCAGGFRAEGAVRLADATIGTYADFNGAHLRDPGGTALDASAATVGSGLFLGRGFTTEGELNLIGTQVRRHIHLNDATLSNPGGRALAAWQLEAGELYLRPKQPPEGLLDLRHARIGVLRDDPATWSPRRQDGLTYDALDPILPATRRLEWLRGDPDAYVPQPYEQLAGTYRRLGHDEEARTVLLHKQRRRRATLPRHSRLWGVVQDVTVGYGYRPLRAAAWFAALLALGATVFTLDPPPPAEAGKGPAFNAVVYALDLLFPLIDFGQEKAFQPTGGGQWIAYALVLAGWVLVTTIATGITRALSRQ
ncbi:hypothetical protein HNP84_009704 [Thermocatellispora tengchongensis]|uniref:Oxidoreductase n=1 Tax=Thermocatellispora tengchongensis TaxID=1073253 RepID=A0A840PQA9_9ACTN|nr:oxidoreductase [Thermocatellispora tengchongensis]MBB5139940.1 hypothetical protein [Thermocatellispora tengchongensis]